MVERDRRRNERRQLRIEVQFGQDGPALTAKISDISLTGLFIDTLTTLDEGEKIFFQFRLPNETNGEYIKGEGLVAWKEEFVGMGIRFSRMRKSDWERMKVYIGQLEK